MLLVLALAASVGCGSADEHPLGGPYGGSSSGTPSPTKGSPTASGNGDPGTPPDDGADSGTPTPSPTPTSGTPAGGNAGPDAGDPGTPPPPPDPDSGTTPPPPPPPPAAPTWTYIVNTYLKSGTVGNCGKSGCHSQMNSPSSAYSWMGQKGYSGAKIADPNRSPITWFGGNMPPSGPSSNTAAETDMNAWAAAGAKNN